MEFFKLFLLAGGGGFAINSCQKKKENIWDIKVETPGGKVPNNDISKEFFDADVPIEQFKEKYPWFQGSVKDEDFIKRKNNPEEIKLYKEAASKTDLNKLATDLTELFARIRHYFPNFKDPKVY